MSIYVIADLHLSFSNPKPMDIFGDNWENHPEKIKQDWISKVKAEDTVLLLGDFSWAMKLEDTLKDFEYLNSLPGKKIMLKGNHDYWWSTVTSIKKFLEENKIDNIDFLYNNSYKIENKVFCGTRGWALGTNDEEKDSEKIVNRELIRLKISLEDAKQKLEPNDELICCLHYPPITQNNLLRNETTPFMQIMKEYGIKKCYYGHLHGTAIKEAVQGNINGIDLKLISADGVDFKLTKIDARNN